MQPHRPSATAQKVAIRRAAHQLLDDPRVFDDPLALRIIGHRSRWTLTKVPGRFQTAASRYLRAFMAARSRFAQEELTMAVRGGVRQVVILGAGLDTFAYRNPYQDVHVFEVDHPATQAWKRQRLMAEQIEIPDSVTFTPMNFEIETISGALAKARFHVDEPAFFSWLGVTPYLACETTLQTLHMIRTMSGGNRVVFDFAIPPGRLSSGSRFEFDRIAGRLAAVGEPLQGFFIPAELLDQLDKMGFGEVLHLDPRSINERFFKDRSDELHVAGNMSHLISARE